MLSILPLGDSITEGGENHPCYRPYLDELLRQTGWDFGFIGPKVDFRGMRHAGYSGKNVEYIETLSEEIFSAQAADVILLHAGHNHFAEEAPVAGILAATKSILQRAWLRNPATLIFLAQVIPSGKLPKYAYLEELNSALAELARSLSDQPLVLVDQASTFDWKSDALDDMVHPNELGARKMALTWFEAMKREQERLSERP